MCNNTRTRDGNEKVKRESFGHVWKQSQPIYSTDCGTQNEPSKIKIVRRDRPDFTQPRIWRKKNALKFLTAGKAELANHFARQRNAIDSSEQQLSNGDPGMCPGN
jgi:hypothetical protein